MTGGDDSGEGPPGLPGLCDGGGKEEMAHAKAAAMKRPQRGDGTGSGNAATP
jgi:hypothetical protein